MQRKQTPPNVLREGRPTKRHCVIFKIRPYCKTTDEVKLIMQPWKRKFIVQNKNDFHNSFIIWHSYGELSSATQKMNIFHKIYDKESADDSLTLASV